MNKHAVMFTLLAIVLLDFLFANTSTRMLIKTGFTKVLLQNVTKTQEQLDAPFSFQSSGQLALSWHF